MNQLILKKAIDIFGTQAKMGRALGVSQSLISKLLRLGRPIPAELVLKIEALTEGRLHRSELRPDLYPPL